MVPVAARSLAVAIVGLALGCALSPGGITREIARAAPPAAIASTLGALNEADNQRMMLRLLASPEMRAVTRALAAEIADGTLAALSEPQRVARIESLLAGYTAAITRAMTRGVAEGLRRDLGPAMTAVTRDAIAAGLREALSERMRQEFAGFATEVTRASIEAASREAAEGFTRDLAPAIHAAMTSERTSAELRAASRAFGREVVLGSNEAMAQIQRAQAGGAKPSFFSRLSSITESGERMIQLVAMFAVALSVALGLWVARLLRRARPHDRERHA